MFGTVSLVLALASCVTCGTECDPSVTYADLSGDVIIGGMFPAHIYDNALSGYVLNMHAVTWSEAMRYAVRQINNDGDLLPGVKLGYDMRDDCNSGEVGTRHALDFMLDTRYLRGASPSTVSRGSGDVSDTMLNCTCRGDRSSKLVAVVGAASSAVSAYVANLFGADYVPQVSYSAASDLFGDKTKYRSFLRTLPSDVHQAEAIASLLQYLNWTYASALASDTDYGRLGLDALRENVKARNMCLAIDQTFNPKLPKSEMDDLMALLSSQYGLSNVVVLWCEVSEAISIIKEANKRGLSNITWIATESWSTHQRLYQEPALGRLTHGIIGVRLEEPYISGFWMYLSQLTAYNHRINPWMNAAWKGYGYSCTEDMLRVDDPDCDDPYYSGMLFPLDKYPFVVSAVYAIAHGLHRELGCSSGVCRKDYTYDYRSLLGNILNSSFDLPDSVTGSSNKYFVDFDEKGDIGFKSYTYVSVDLDRPYSPFAPFGTWIAATQNMTIREDQIKWKIPGYLPRARCGLTCLLGEYLIAGSSPCCWQCAQCPEDKISTTLNQRSCEPCSPTQVSNKERTACLNLAESKLTISSTAGLIVCVLSMAGVLLTLTTLLLFFCHWNTPVIRSSSREMSCIQLFSILVLFCMPAFFVVHTSAFVCAFRTVLFGTSFGNVVAFIVVKTYRLLRVFQERFTKVSKFLQTKYQVFFSFLLVAIELVMCLVWFAIYRPRTEIKVSQDAMQYFIHCGKLEDGLLFILLGYIFMLALASAFMAYRARKLPENFNEAQFISFAMFTSCLVWIAFVPLYFSLGVESRPIVFMTVNLASSFSLLVILYGFKVRIILFFPTLNSQEHFRRVAANATVKNFIKDKGDPKDGDRPRVQSVVSFDFNMSRFSTRSLPDRHSSVDNDTAVVRVHHDGTRVSLDSNGAALVLSSSLEGRRSASVGEGLQIRPSTSPSNQFDVRDGSSLWSPPGFRAESPKRPPTELDVLLDLPLDAIHELPSTGLITSPITRMHPNSLSASSSGDTASSKTSFSTTRSSSTELPVDGSRSTELPSATQARPIAYIVSNEGADWSRTASLDDIPSGAVTVNDDDEKRLLWASFGPGEERSDRRSSDDRARVSGRGTGESRHSTDSNITTASRVSETFF